ncbi:erythroid differentiation-related factor 1 [Cimex lectularius]|uniref:Erythroid differentiation-related factor 1 n=1 Tax=Cimex lectularius TaxID=79782 RepID=A0A8I6SAN3_CIMLE|nr:erythroid differentiation-related factor 1 [Cimex lectularius]
MTSVNDDIPFEHPTGLGPSSNRQSPVKSNAIVMYSAITNPVSFATLQSNTDIKLPPSNWLKSYADSYGLNYSLPRTTGFTSFHMANMFPDCVGEVDVVSDAENIKKLLKIPYSDSTVSMMVHRVENTLLIDEFDIHKHLLSRAENDWTWLRKFFFDHIIETLSAKDKSISLREKSRYALQQKSLVSKFLHYSLVEPEEEVETNDLPLNTPSLPLTREPALPEPPLEEGLPDSSNYKYIRNVVWSFEDIQMLLGTDMPIFGGPTRPCISLRLRDATKPISVLTGIDYWLDNLMSNVPEVVMCYHLDGIVQKYELIKTEDLPHLAESRFSPKLIRDVAQNILSFLKSNATKAGHTYWLFKGTNDDAVKLYDLTSLCSDTLEEKGQNPFTVPVGMLLYRVARNMKANGGEGQLATIRILLKNCLSLLDKEKYPHIVTSAHFILSDVYVPCDTDPSSPELLVLPESGEDVDEGEDDSDSGILRSVPVTDLCVSNYTSINNKYSPPPMTGGLEERCNLALQHVSEGLDCLQYFEKSNFKPQEKIKKEEEEPKMAKPFEAIPMPYSKLDQKEKNKKKRNNSEKENDSEQDDGESKSLKTLLCRTSHETMPTWQKSDKSDINSWKYHLSCLLTKKACLVYSILIEKEILMERYHLALKHIQGVLRCCGKNKDLVGLMLNRAGDCFFNSANKPELCQTEADKYPTVERPGQSLYEKELEMISKTYDGPEDLLNASIACYTRSLELYYSIDTMRKTGNACNVLNTFYTNRAAGLLQENRDKFDEAEFEKCVTNAHKLLALGLKNFEAVGDKTNCSLLMCNMGRLHRLKAHSPSVNASTHLSPQQKHFYNKALESYTAGLQYLGTRKTNPQIWEVVHWELSSALFTFATITQDNQPPTVDKTYNDVEREVIDLLQRALKHCDTTSNSPYQLLYQYRAAKLHHRLASLYYNSYRFHSCDTSKKRALLHLLEVHYSTAYSHFTLLENPVDMLRVQLERESLEEYMAEEGKSQKLKKKHYLNALKLASQCKEAIQIIEESNAAKLDKEKEVEETEESEEEETLITLLLQRIQFLLKSLIKLISADKQSGPIEKFKMAYAASLKKEASDSKIIHLNKVLDLIQKECLVL